MEFQFGVGLEIMFVGLGWMFACFGIAAVAFVVTPKERPTPQETGGDDE